MGAARRVLRAQLRRQPGLGLDGVRQLERPPRLAAPLRSRAARARQALEPAEQGGNLVPPELHAGAGLDAEIEADLGQPLLKPEQDEVAQLLPLVPQAEPIL